MEITTCKCGRKIGRFQNSTWVHLDGKTLVVCGHAAGFAEPNLNFRLRMIAEQQQRANRASTPQPVALPN